MAFHLLQRDRDGAKQLASVLFQAVDEIGYCQVCRTLTEADICDLCTQPSRDKSILCVVESPADVWVVDQATVFNGIYFVLHGRLSPLDGIGPDEIGLDLLRRRFAEGEIKEIILATNSTVEGEATASFIADVAKKHHIQASRIAHGVPLGGELEFIDSGTLSHAFSGRREMI
jgi:recombination protein RecR